ncbi:MAG: hypothetical protein OXN92_02450 [Gammaproteobacteria bacterium]|nr:hypothetical protein [Gammaproteobacteria bacterium]
MHRELTRHKRVTLQLLWLEYREAHPEGYQYSRFCDRYRERRGRLDVVLRQVYQAGEKAFVDYAGPTVEVTARRTGEIHDAKVFVGYWRRRTTTFVDVTMTRSPLDWTVSHVSMAAAAASPRIWTVRRSSRPRPSATSTPSGARRA